MAKNAPGVATSKLAEIVDIVRSMNEQGSTLAQIRDTLLSAGLEDEVIDDVIRKAGVQPTPAEVQSSLASLHEQIASGEHVKPLASALAAQKKSTEEMHDKISYINDAVDEHAASLDRLHSRVEQLRSTHGELKESLSDIGELNQGIQEIKDLVLEIKPTLAALKDLNERLLSTNREILMRLKR